MPEKTDLLFEEYTIDTPENVIFDYHIAGIGSRFIGAVVDMLIISVMVTSLSLFLALLAGVFGESSFDVMAEAESDIAWGLGVLAAIYFLVQFIVMWGYFTLFEIILNGQTPGKRVAKTRVVLQTGSPAGAIPIVIRNLVRMIDWLPSSYLVGFITMLLNDQSRRLGDYAAGTIVIRLQDDGEEGLLQAVSGAHTAIHWKNSHLSLEEINRLFETYPHIDRLTPQEYELAEEVTFGPQADLVDAGVRPRLAKIISPKVGGPLPDPPGSNIEATRILKEIVLLYNIYHADAEKAQPTR